MQKIQYYAEDLAYALDIGEIADMHVDTTDSGKQVLRITCMEKEKEEYKTVRASKKPVQKKAQTPPREAAPKPLNFDRDVPAPATSFGAKAGAAFKDWLHKPMKRPDEW